MRKPIEAGWEIDREQQSLVCVIHCQECGYGKKKHVSVKALYRWKKVVNSILQAVEVEIQKAFWCKHVKESKNYQPPEGNPLMQRMVAWEMYRKGEKNGTEMVVTGKKQKSRRSKTKQVSSKKSRHSS